MAQFVDNEWFETWSCGECGVRQAVSLAAWNGRKSSGKSFYCFNGHSRVFRETTEVKLKLALERERQVREAAEARAMTAETNLEQVSKAHRKMRERVMNGVCPCCNRSFGNLRDHMRTEHPEFGREKTVRALRVAFGMSQTALALEAGVNSVYVSQYENSRYIPRHAKRKLDDWLETHSAKAAET